MKLPPFTVAVRIVEERRTKLRIWFPLFLLWPVMLVFLLLTLVVSLLVDGVRLAAGCRRAYTRLVIGGMEVVAETRGADILVENAHRTVAVTLR